MSIGLWFDKLTMSGFLAHPRIKYGAGYERLINNLVLFVFIVSLITLLTGCGQTVSPPASQQPGFNFIFKYGVNARNEIDTFKGTYTKDMIMDPSITIPLTLTEDEMDSIYKKMVDIDFFSYPDVFKVEVPPGGPAGLVTPHNSYFFRVQYDSQVKELEWEDEITNEDEKADRLRGLIKLIRDSIEAKEEYKKLPSPRGGYL